MGELGLRSGVGASFTFRAAGDIIFRGFVERGGEL